MQAQEGRVSKEHCRAMEGWRKKRTSTPAAGKLQKGDLRDAQIVAHYLRMSQSGMAGFGTAAAYAGALGICQTAEAGGLGILPCR
jgi:hypothetical protein